MLIIQLVGGPEHAAAICETYKQCSDEGAEMATLYAAEKHEQPHTFTYRIVPVLIVPEDET
jgi:hypothetical protein